MMKFTQLQSHLRDSDAVVTFTKRNGDTRVMRCTLRPEIVPQTTGSSNHPKGQTMIVFDTEIEAWRSFRLDSVTKIELI